MRVTVIGAGHVGLVTALGLAEIGHRVTAVENDVHTLERLLRGEPTIHENLIPQLLRRHLPRNVRFTSSIAEGMRAPEVVFICVGTPPLPSGAADLRGVVAAARAIAAHLRKRVLIVEKSTVPVGTCDTLRNELLKAGVDPSLFRVACNPEFLREGSAVSDFLHPDRIVLGADDEDSRAILRVLYRPLTHGDYYACSTLFPGNLQHCAPVLETSIKSAELIKHASNAALAMSISFINAIANIAEATGADIDDVAAGIGADSRIGTKFLRAGIGYGGSCFPKDVDEFRRIAERTGYCFALLSEVQRINAGQRQIFLEKVRAAVGPLCGRKLAILGLSFKAGTDDIRCSPAIAIVKRLLEEGASIAAYDPAAMENARQELLTDRIQYCSNMYQPMDGAHALLILTEWPEFSRLDLRRVRSTLASRVVADGRNLYRPQEMEAAGITYVSIGRATVSPIIPIERDDEEQVLGVAHETHASDQTL